MDEQRHRRPAARQVMVRPLLLTRWVHRGAVSVGVLSAGVGERIGYLQCRVSEGAAQCLAQPAWVVARNGQAQLLAG